MTTAHRRRDSAAPHDGSLFPPACGAHAEPRLLGHTAVARELPAPARHGARCAVSSQSYAFRNTCPKRCSTTTRWRWSSRVARRSRTIGVSGAAARSGKTSVEEGRRFVRPTATWLSWKYSRPSVPRAQARPPPAASPSGGITSCETESSHPAPRRAAPLSLPRARRRSPQPEFLLRRLDLRRPRRAPRSSPARPQSFPAVDTAGKDRIHRFDRMALAQARYRVPRHQPESTAFRTLLYARGAAGRPQAECEPRDGRSQSRSGR